MRVGIRCLGCRSSSVHRAIYTVLSGEYGQRLEQLDGKSTYELSAHGAFFEILQKYAARSGFTLTCSEYMASVRSGDYQNGVRCEDIEKLTFEDNSFHLVTSTEVMEHVEDDNAGYREVHRVLKPSGQYIFSVPLDMTQTDTIIRAERAANGTIKHLLPPEYHGDPRQGLGGVFTWRNYGRDIVKQLRTVGFEAEIMVIKLSEFASRQVSGIPIVRAWKL